MEEGREWKFSDLLADGLDLCGKLEEDLKVIVQRFDEVCRRRGLKVNANKSEVMVLGGEERLEYEIRIDGARFEQIFGVCFG